MNGELLVIDNVHCNLETHDVTAQMVVSGKPINYGNSCKRFYAYSINLKNGQLLMIENVTLEIV